MPDRPLISGTVRDPHGVPVPEARVYFTSGPVSLPDIAVLTGSDGSFTLAVPAAGTYRIEAAADGFLPISATVTAAGGERTEVDLRLGVNP